MNSVYLQEAFKELNLLTEEDLNLSDINDDAELDFDDEIPDGLGSVDIIDDEAETEEEVKDSYVGKVILDCCTCHSKLYRDPADVELSEDGEIVNEDEECPFCYSTDGFKIIGQVEPYTEETTEIEITSKDNDVDDEDSEPIFDSEEDVEEIETEEEKEDVEESLTEDLNNLEFDTENEHVSIHSTEKEIPGEQMVAPISDDTQTQIENQDASEEEVPEEDINQEVSVEDNTEESAEDIFDFNDSEDVDVPIEDFDEESFDQANESYLRKKFENVNSYKTVGVTSSNNKLFVEGIIKFNSGNARKTNYILEAYDSDNKNVRFNVSNKEMVNESYILTGKVNNNKLITELFK